MKRNNSGPFSSEPIRVTTLVLLLTAGFPALNLSVGAQSTSQQEDNTLAAAIAAGKVTAQFTGMGASSGDAVRVTVQKTAAAGPGTLALTIPPGTVLRSSNPSEQNMVIAGVRGRQIDAQRFTPQSQIVLTGTAAVTYVLEAYCAEFHKGNPSPTTAFSMGPGPRSPTPDPGLSRILTEGKKRNLSTRALQAAIWIASDNVTYEQMSPRFPLSRAEMDAGRTLVESLRSQQTTTAPTPRPDAQSADGRVPVTVFNRGILGLELSVGMDAEKVVRILRPNESCEIRVQIGIVGFETHSYDGGMRSRIGTLHRRTVRGAEIWVFRLEESFGLWLWTLDQVEADGGAAASTVLQGTNPAGDTVLWDTDKVWKTVTVTGLERKSTGTLLTIKDTPAGFPAGKYRDFKEVALRGGQLPAPPVENPIDATRLYSVGYSPQNATNLGPFAPHDDTFFAKWWGVTQWDSLAVKPENAAPVQYQDGVKVLAQFKVTITHVAVKDGNCYLLVRRNAGQMLPEGWYYNIDEAIFQRESPGTKR